MIALLALIVSLIKRK
ncbi:hypothetical protein GI584_23390 [Gracilibacillus salitolerans]|uniref:Uncharacterized protein n=1 Tax=Gracilibacillus salitolerans TaxID=2663022 RepID=A0A5Q2TSV4_9BACI|nr:hypothetical protein GI584_23390 [Gracilibacillus salitolerans]